jgi:hypothetical protein
MGENGTTLKNKPVIIICDNEKGKYILINIAIWTVKNAIKKESKEDLKFKKKETEI